MNPKGTGGTTFFSDRMERAGKGLGQECLASSLSRDPVVGYRGEGGDGSWRSDGDGRTGT